MDDSLLPRASGEDSAFRSKSKKRTRTGCLTCRRRRIKCGEERPICQNCIKSKRLCEGYNQRVIFKPPAFDHRSVPHGGSHITLPAATDQSHGFTSQQGPHAMPLDYVPHGAAFGTIPPDPQMTRYQTFNYPSPPTTQPLEQVSDFVAHGQLPTRFFVPNSMTAEFDVHHAAPGVTNAPLEASRPAEGSYGFIESFLQWNGGHAEYDVNRHSIFDLADPTQLLTFAAIETYGNGRQAPYHVQETYDTASGDTDQRKALSSILQLNSVSIQALQTRRYDTFLYPGVLDTYRVERVASPLNNPATARVFAHFISATAPSLSIFERRPRNASVLFSDDQVPFSEQGLWTCTMPKLALHHQGLLHAMLALSSLHVARLTGAARTPSVQHYAWALKRVHHCVGHPQKRLEVATIAASMLLGYYELIAADHMKWNLHLAGSKQLFIETDFIGMANQFRRMKLERAVEHQLRHNGKSPRSYDSPGHLIDQVPDIDERLVSRFVGREVRYTGHGRVEPSTPSIPTPMDLSEFEILKDLFWWYCKQDAYMSVTGGIPLVLDYSRWADCPPRAPIGQIDAVYGSFDHLTLLLGRVADFTSRDRARKIRQIEANGGSWRPHKNMKMPAPPAPPGGRGDHAPSVSPPAFYGMAPPPQSVGQMPSSYGRSQSRNQPTAEEEYTDLPFALEEAIQEYNAIRAALDEFAASLGEGFESLKPQYQPPMATPFGPALFYRNYDISCLWAIYHMAVIIAIRSHPYMPPAAHMAAAVAAKQTEFHANEIGRISAGIVPDSFETPLDPALGAALCEIIMPIFFAAIQYRDAAQRETTVRRILGISRRTGWGSAELIANGCETAWVKAAAAGRGPPYTRLGRHGNTDDPRVNGSWEELDPDADPDDKDDSDRRLVKKSGRARLLWGIGVIGEERDEAVRRGYRHT